MRQSGRAAAGFFDRVTVLPKDVRLQVSAAIVIIDNQDPFAGVVHSLNTTSLGCNTPWMASISMADERFDFDITIAARRSRPRSYGSRIAEVRTIAGIAASAR